MVSTLACLTAVGGCAMTFDARSLGVAASMSSPVGQPVVGDTFALSSHAVHMFWGLYPLHMPNLQDALASQTTGGANIQNLRISIRRRPADALITLLTAGIVDPITVTFQGVVVPVQH